jgi:hypothetical protein
LRCCGRLRCGFCRSGLRRLRGRFAGLTGNRDRHRLRWRRWLVVDRHIAGHRRNCGGPQQQKPFPSSAPRLVAAACSGGFR